MKCSDFEQRFHQLLDDRLSPEDDLELLSHAEQCAECDRDLVIWSKIDSVFADQPAAVSMTVSSSFRDRVFWRAASVVGAVAAAILFVVLLNPFMPKQPKTFAQSRPTAVQSPVVDPIQWWESVQGQDWLAGTMPAVRSMQNGVAPLGRSFKHAVTILTRTGAKAS